MSWQTDKDFEQHTITNVEENPKTYSLGFGGMGFGIPKLGVVPRVGDQVKLYGDGFGLPVRGVVINDQLVYYRTSLEQKGYQKLQSNKYRLEKQIKFYEQRVQLDRDYAALPVLFQQRIDRFRRNNPEFRAQHEAYELFVCQEALKIAEALKSPQAVEEFKQAKDDQQKQLVPNLDGNHSGNTLGCATFLTGLFLTTPELVIQAHGALCQVVGCESYGCKPKGQH